MAQKRFWIGSLGPFFYDDTDALHDPDGVISDTQKTVYSEGQVHIDEAPTEDNHVLRKKDLEAALVSGMILMWSGAVEAIPVGWVLCDGANGTPDLTDKFILGAGGAAAVGDTGGQDSVTLVEGNLPAHTHSISADGDHSGHDTGTVEVQSGSGTFVNTGDSSPGDHSHTGSTGSVGSATAFDNRPSYYALAFIMKA